MKNVPITHKYNEKKVFHFYKDVLFPQDTRNDTHLFFDGVYHTELTLPGRVIRTI